MTKKRFSGRPRLVVEFLELRDLPSADWTGNLLLQYQPGGETALPELVRKATLEQSVVHPTRIEGLYRLEGDSIGLARLQAQVQTDARVQYIEPEYIGHKDLTPNDPFFQNNTLWGLNGTNGIRAPAAWDLSTGSTAVVLAGIDSGINYDHADLFRNIWINQGEIPAVRRSNLTDTDGDGLITFWDLNVASNQGVGKITDTNSDGRITGRDLLAPFNTNGTGGWANGVSDDGGSFIDDLIGWDFVNNDNDPMDDDGHGTHTAGIMMAQGNNGLGVTGVNWRAQVMALKWLDTLGNGNIADAATAIRYAADRGARVSNNSYGFNFFSNTVFNAINYAAGLNHLVVASAGNENTNNDQVPHYPSNYNLSNIISVAATAFDGTRASFSNFGAATVDLGAPGEDIYSTQGTGYAFGSGTSQAGPYVAGVAGLLWAQNPTWHYSQVSSRILTNVTPLPSLAGITSTGGLLNAQLALQGSGAIDLNWVGGGISGPATALTTTSFTISRNYTVSGAFVPNSFGIAYYRSTDTTFGNADDVLLGTQAITTTADRTIGSHPGNSQNLLISAPGTYFLFARLDSSNGVTESNENNNVALAPQPLVVSRPETLKVSALTWTNSGFVADFNVPFDPALLNLYDTATAFLGPADITLTDAGGNPVAGSVVVDPANTKITFVRTEGLLLPAATPATLTLRSALNGFRRPGSTILDGNGNGTIDSPDDYLATLTGTPPVFDTVLSIPNVMRGPGQSVQVPADSTGLPLRLSSGAGVQSVSLTLLYNPAQLSITAAARGPNTPVGATVMLNTSTAGQAIITFNSPSALGAGPIDFAILTANVPSSAPYASKQVLDLSGVQVNGGALTALDDDGLQVVAYLGDTNADGRYSSGDAQRALRVAVGLDSGFSAYQLADPVVVADVGGNGQVNSGDATRIMQEGIGLDQPQIPPLPSLPALVPGGPDPLLQFPRHFRGRPGDTVTVPLLLDPSDGLTTVDLAISYDLRRLEVLSVERGSLTEDFDLFAVHLDAASGTIRAGLSRTNGAISARGTGSVLMVTFRIRPDAPAGKAILNLRQDLGTTLTLLNENGLDLNPDPSNSAGDALDGAIAVRHPKRALRPEAVEFRVRRRRGR